MRKIIINYNTFPTMVSSIIKGATGMKTTSSFVYLFLAVNFLCGNAVEKFKLSSGYEIPVVGLGTASMKPEEMDVAIANALKTGYRHFDVSSFYHNEEALGRALKKWIQNGGKREDLFITWKLPGQGNRPDSVEKFLKHLLKDLSLEYIDMFLIHAPFGVKEGENLTAAETNGNVIFENVDHIALWKKIEEQVSAGRTKSIGLSNFNESQILNVYNSAKIKPSNVQVESHAYLQQRSLREFCKKYDIVMTAYAPIGSPSSRHKLHKGSDKDLPSLIDLPEIKNLAKKYNKSESQILLRHSVQAGLVVIPKSSNKDRQKANIDIFDFTLSEEDIALINDLDKGEKGRVFTFIGFYKGVDKNPQYPFPIPS